MKSLVMRSQVKKKKKTIKRANKKSHKFNNAKTYAVTAGKGKNIFFSF